MVNGITMKFLLLNTVTLLILAVHTQGSTSVEWAAKHNHRIVGGSTAPDGAFPYMASLRVRIPHEQHICGGGILNQRWILTAAHCTDAPDSMYLLVVVGSNRIKGADSNRAYYQVEEIINHPGWNPDLHANDISLIRVSMDIVMGPKVSTLNLPSRNTEGGATLSFSGWGYLAADQPSSAPNNLQMAMLKSISHQKCAQIHTNIQKSILCTFTRTGQGVCSGDSGSPLVENNEVVGVASWGIPCGVGFPDGFTRVWSFKQWIQSNMY